MRAQLLRFITSGLASFGINMALLFLLVGVFDVWYLWATSAGFLVSLGSSFLLQKYWTFGDRSRHRLSGQMGSYAALAVFNLLANDGLMYSLVGVLGVPYLLAQIIVSALIASWSFLAYRHLFHSLPHRNDMSSRTPSVVVHSHAQPSPKRWHVFVFPCVLIVALINFFAFGHHPAPAKGDAVEYLAYARNIAIGAGYSIDGHIVSIEREPAYPILLAVVYSFSGSNSGLAMSIVQVILLAGTAYFIFQILKMLDFDRAGLVAALTVVIVPSFAYYANLALTETFFTFLLVISCWLMLRSAFEPRDWKVYVLLGTVFGMLALTKSHMILFPFVACAYLWFKTRNSKMMALVFVVFTLIIFAWVGFVYNATGAIAITNGRQELHLYARASRSALTYTEQVRYLIDWISRSTTGGTETELLRENEPRAFSRQYNHLLAAGEAASDQRSQDIRAILTRPGRFLFGNLIEWTKMMFVEHLFPPVSRFYTRGVRALSYVLIYAAFASGIFQLVRLRRVLNVGDVMLMQVVALFIVYHWVLLPFFDVVPRFNTPYIALYILLGVFGVSRAMSNSTDLHG